MDITRRRLLLASLIGVAAGTSGCASTAGPVIQTYSETISSLFVTQDGSKLLVVGQRYHYFFDAPPHLVQALSAPWHEQMTGELSSFHVDTKGVITGRYTLRVPAALPDAQRSEAQALGFARVDGAPDLSLIGDLQGKRYLENTFRVHRIRQTLNKPYTVEISAEQGLGDRIADTLATPLSTAAEGVTMLYYGALAPVLIPFSVISREKKN